MASLSTPRPGPVVRPPAIALRLASDARLTKLATAGSDAAMAAIFERHHQALYRYCHSIVGNEHDAADALQNAMMKALRALQRESRQIALRPWLYRIAHNESISLLRARRPESDLDSATHLSDAAAGNAIESRERVRSLAEDLGELTERQRGALLMRELGGLEFTEVAEALQTSPAAVKQSVYEARCGLQAMQEGRAMVCDDVQRTLSDGDLRMLRGMRMRGHLRDCARCSAFAISLRERPSQLRALLPPLPVAAAAGMLHSILGGGGASSGSGAAVGMTGTAKVTAGMSIAAKAASVVAVSATIAGGATYAVPGLRSDAPQDAAPSAPALVNSAGRPATASAPGAATGSRGSGLQGSATTSFVGANAVESATAGNAGTGVAGAAGTPGAGSGRVGAGKPAGTPGAKPAGAGKPAGTPGAKPSGPGRPSSAGRPSGTGRPSGAGKPAETPTARPSGAGKPAGNAPATGKPAVKPGGETSGAVTPARTVPAGSGAGGSSRAGSPAGAGAAGGTPTTADPSGP